MSWLEDRYCCKFDLNQSLVMSLHVTGERRGKKLSITATRRNINGHNVRVIKFGEEIQKDLTGLTILQLCHATKACPSFLTFMFGNLSATTKLF